MLTEKPGNRHMFLCQHHEKDAMQKIKLLDVTLRDGGYKNHFHFLPEEIETLLKTLDQSGVQYIELGYRNGPLQSNMQPGITGICNRNYLECCQILIRNAKRTVMVHPIHVDESDFKEMRVAGVQAIRVCYSALHRERSFKTIAFAKEYGFEVFVNITRSSRYTKEELLQMIRNFTPYQPQAVYLADSNGSFTPGKVQKLFSYLLERCCVPLGFHAHDNLFLALSNAVAAMQVGVEYLDASINGYGKGAGNLRLEAISSFLCAHGVRTFDLCKILDIAGTAELNLKNATSRVSKKNVMMGIFDLSQDEEGNFTNHSSFADYDRYLQQQQRRVGNG